MTRVLLEATIVEGCVSLVLIKGLLLMLLVVVDVVTLLSLLSFVS